MGFNGLCSMGNAEPINSRWGRWSWACWISKLRNHPQMLIFFAYRNLKEIFFFEETAVGLVLNLEYIVRIWKRRNQFVSFCFGKRRSKILDIYIINEENFSNLWMWWAPSNCAAGLYLRYSRFLDNFLVLLRLYFILSWMATFFFNLSPEQAKDMRYKGYPNGSDWIAESSRRPFLWLIGTRASCLAGVSCLMLARYGTCDFLSRVLESMDLVLKWTWSDILFSWLNMHVYAFLANLTFL